MRGLGMPRVIGFYVMTAAIAGAAILGRDGVEGLVPDWRLGPIAWRLALGAGVGVAIVALTRLAVVCCAWASCLADEFRSLLGPLCRREALLLALMSGVAEETLFRGVLQPALGLVLAAAVFGVLHVGPNVRFIPWTIMAFAAGLVLGALFSYTGGLLAPAAAHVTVNYLNLRYLAWRPTRPELVLKPVGGERVVEL